VKIPRADELAITWGVAVDTIYSRTSGRAHVTALDLDDLARRHRLDRGEIVEHFAARRRRYLERIGEPSPPAEPDVTDSDREAMRRVAARVAERAAAEINAGRLVDSEDDDGG